MTRRAESNIYPCQSPVREQADTTGQVPGRRKMTDKSVLGW